VIRDASSQPEHGCSKALASLLESPLWSREAIELSFPLKGITVISLKDHKATALSLISYTIERSGQSRRGALKNA
jgi:hypothetical protein